MQPDSARTALQIFAQGKGDVLLTYENEAIYAEKKGVHTEYKTPKATLLIEKPVALTKSGLKKPAAKAFYKYLCSSHGAEAVRRAGLPARSSRARRKGYHFFKPPGLFTIHGQARAHGWAKVNKRFFDPNKGIMAKIEKSLGQLTPQYSSAPPACASGRAGGGSRRGIAIGYLSLVVLLPLAALVWSARAGGLAEFWHQATEPEAIAALKLTLGARRRLRRSSTPSPAPRPPGCSSATTSAARASSTRSSTCRSRCRRSSRG